MGVGQIGSEAGAPVVSPGSRRVTGRIAIFDRDGTIIDVVRDDETGTIVTAFHPDQIRFLPGVIEGMRALAAAGFTLAIATNQPGPAKGQCSAAAVTRTNKALVARLAAEGIAIASVQVCMHHPQGGEGGDTSLVMACECRKPRAGMLEAILREMAASSEARAQSWMIGDARADIEAARAAGLHAGLVFSADRCELCPLRGGPQFSPPQAGEPLATLLPDVHGPTVLAIARQIAHPIV